MRISLVLLFALTLQLSATNVFGQRMRQSINMRNVTLGQVLNKIEQVSDYVFLYNNKTIDSNTIVSVQNKSKEIPVILNELFRGTDISYTIVNKQIILSINANKGNRAQQQQKTKNIIKGTVVDSKGEPLIGVSVRVKGATNGTITDVNGQFALEGSSTQPLEFSYVGYGTKIVRAAQGMRIVLQEDAKALDEVVVVGYGVQKKSTLTGSVTAIKGDEISHVAASNVGSTLAGRLPGLIAYNRAGEPGNDDAQLNLRGFGSPLIIVDGVEVRDFQKMNPDDIESFSVLKDASASIYGSRAGNGVILIQTKRGKVGKPSLSFNSTFSWQSDIRTIKYVDVNDFIMLWNEAAVNSGMPERKYSDAQIEKYKEQGGTDWYGETFRNSAPMQTYNVDLRGGNDRVKYYIAAGFMHQAGLLRSNDQQVKRYNIRSNIDIQLLSNLSISFDIAGTWNNTDVPAVGMWDTYANINIAHPTDPAYWPDHNYAPKSAYHGEWPSTALWTRKDFGGYRRNDDYSILPSVAIKYDFKFLKGLSAKAFFNYRIDNVYEKRFAKSYAIYDYNADTNVYTKTREYPADLQEHYWNVKKATPQISLSYHNVFNKVHDLSLLALYEYNTYYSNEFQAERKGFLSNEVDQLSAGEPTSQTNGGGAYQEGRASWIGRANYSYMNKYLFEALVRIDGSSKFAKSKRWGTFPGVSLGWRVSEEDFMKKYDWLDNLKLRASFGMAGNDNNSLINNYQYLNGYSKSGNYVFGANQTVVDGLATRGLSNPDITWEKTTTYNFGVDFSLWRSKLYGNVDVFYRKVSDVFGDQSQSLPNTFGATLPQLNINSFNDRGIEVTLGHIGKTKDLRYSIEGNIAWTRSKWGHYDEPVYKDENERERLQKSGQWRNRWFGYKSAGIFRSQEEINAWKVDQDGQGNKTLAPGDIKYLDLNNDGVLSDRDQTVIGRSDVPELTFGLKTGLQWRGFDFNMLWQGAGLVNTEYTLHLRRPFFDSATPTVSFLKRFDAVDNPNGSWPRMTFDNSSNNDKESDFWLQNATYIRLKNIELGYTLPKTILNKINLSSLRFFIAATNLLTIDNVDTIDPEVGAGDRGWRYPTQKTVSFGFNLNF